MTPVEGAPGIFRKGNRFVVVYRDRGKQRKHSCRTLTEARNFQAKTRLGQVPAADTRLLFVNYAATWLASYDGRTAHGLRESTRASYDDAIKRVIIPYFRKTAPTLKLAAVSPKDLRDFVSYLAAQTYSTGEGKSKRTAHYSAATIRRYFAPLRALLATAAEDGLIVRNPAAGMRVVVPSRKPQAIGGEGSANTRDGGMVASTSKRLTPEQTKALLAEIPKEHQDLVWLLASSGVRIGEALALRWRDFRIAASDDDSSPTQDGGAVLTISTSKTAAGLRTLSLSPAMARRLIKRRSMVEHNADNSPIFANPDGGRLDQHNWRSRIFKPAARRAGVPSATPHQLRHGFASMLADEGYGAPQIASALGHADNGVTALRWYIRTKPIEAPSFIDRALGHE
jgi:integrase